MFDLVGDAHGQRGGTRIAVIGSCRVHEPFETLANLGRAVRVWANASSATHTFSEARQIIRYTRGEFDIPEALRPFIFFPPQLPPRTATDKRILETADVVFVEVSELWQISHEPYSFQVNFFYKEFVSKYGGPLLPWYRAFSLRQPIGDDIINDALGKLADRGADELALIERVLRQTRLNSPDVDTATTILDDIMFDRTKKWVFVSHFVVPGLAGTQMKDRAQLIDIVRQAAERRGAVMFDPSIILEERGREAALASGGRDIYHYNPDIYEPVADLLLTAGGLITSESAAAALHRPKKTSVATATEWVNNTLIALHEQRVATLGVDDSGLYAHYKGLMDSRQIAGSTVGDLANLIVNLLPRFDRYDVLRAGLGELAFILAASGLRATAFEPNPRRFGALVAGLDKMANDDPEATRRLAVGLTSVPDAPPNGRTLAVAHHLIGLKPEQQEQVLAQLSSYDALLIDPRIFIFSRSTEAEREAIVEAVRSLGFTQIREFPKLGIVFCSKPIEGSATAATKPVSDAAEPSVEAPPAEVRAWTLKGPFENEGGSAWVLSLPVGLREKMDNEQRPYQSHLRLFENGQELGPGHARHDTIRKSGGGHYSFWSGLLYFSASDGSDPNTNGRSYTVSLVD
ncbi:MAG: hypothetical protein K2X72_19740 [Reyranella sp.]|nr:hypothetical protein [Reyranella sp.]